MPERSQTITIVKKSATVADPAEGNRRDAQVGRDVVLRNPLQYIRALFQQFLIALLRTVFNTGEEELLIKDQPLYHMGFNLFFYGRGLVQDRFKIFPGNLVYDTGLNAFQVEEAGLMGAETFDRGNAFAFKKELEGDVFAVVVEPDPEATFFDEISSFGNLPFP